MASRSIKTRWRHRIGTLAGLLAITFTFGFVLAGCGGSTSEPAPTPSSSQSVESDFLAANGLEGLDARKIIDRLDTMPVDQRPTDLMASIEPNELILTDGGNQEVRLPMPENQVYVSVAPYRTQTHDCHFHSLTTCRGELSNTEVAIELTGRDGTKLVKETRKTFDNGFVGFWVPRGVKADLTIEAGGRTATETLSTVKADDATCVTTMKLT